MFGRRPAGTLVFDVCTLHFWRGDFVLCVVRLNFNPVERVE